MHPHQQQQQQGQGGQHMPPGGHHMLMQQQHIPPPQQPLPASNAPNPAAKPPFQHQQHQFHQQQRVPAVGGPLSIGMPGMEQQPQQMTPIHLPPQQIMTQGPSSMDTGRGGTMQPSQQFARQDQIRGPPAPAGPLKQFQSTHLQQQQQQQQTSMWMQDHHDSGFQTMASSAAPSVISGISGMSLPDDMSMISGQQLTEEQQQRFANIPSQFPGHSHCAPPPGEQVIDPAAIADAIPELITLLEDEDEEVVMKAAQMVYRFSKYEANSPPHAPTAIRGTALVEALVKVIAKHEKPEILKHGMGALFHISSRPDSLNTINQVVYGTPNVPQGQLIHELVKRMSNFALLTLHSLLEQGREAAAQARHYARQADALCGIVKCLANETNEKQLTIAVDCARHLFRHDKQQKMRFLQLGGPDKLVRILHVCNYEKLLYTTTVALRGLTYLPETGQAIVNVGGVQALSRRLDHASQRLLHASLECLCALSEFQIAGDVNETLGKLLQLLGVQDGRLVLHCLGVLQNMAANNQKNKEYLFKSKAIGHLIRVLQTANAGLPGVDALQLEELKETALTTLRNLTTGFNGAEQAQKDVLRGVGDTAADVYLSALVSMRPKILKQTLMILNRASLFEPNLALLREGFLQMDEIHHIGFVEAVARAVGVAYAYSTQGNGEIEDVKMTALLWPGLATLQNMCRDRVMFQQVLQWLRPEKGKEQLRPMDVLSQLTDENVQRSAVGLMRELVRDPEVANAVISGGNAPLHMFHALAQSPSQAVATYAGQILQTLQQYQAPAAAGSMGDAFYWSQDPTEPDDPFANVFVQQNSQQQMQEQSHQQQEQYQQQQLTSQQPRPTQQQMLQQQQVPYPSPMMMEDGQVGSPASPMIQPSQLPAHQAPTEMTQWHQQQPSDWPPQQ